MDGYKCLDSKKKSKHAVKTVHAAETSMFNSPPSL